MPDTNLLTRVSSEIPMVKVQETERASKKPKILANASIVRPRLDLCPIISSSRTSDSAVENVTVLKKRYDNANRACLLVMSLAPTLPDSASNQSLGLGNQPGGWVAAWNAMPTKRVAAVSSHPRILSRYI